MRGEGFVNSTAEDWSQGKQPPEVWNQGISSKEPRGEAEEPRTAKAEEGTKQEHRQGRRERPRSTAEAEEWDRGGAPPEDWSQELEPPKV